MSCQGWALKLTSAKVVLYSATCSSLKVIASAMLLLQVLETVMQHQQMIKQAAGATLMTKRPPLQWTSKCTYQRQIILQQMKGVNARHCRQLPPVQPGQRESSRKVVSCHTGLSQGFLARRPWCEWSENDIIHQFQREHRAQLI